MTRLLASAGDGDASAVEALLPIVYAELRGLARAVFSSQNPAHTLQPTALVHEAWLKLNGSLGSIDDRRHFFVVAGRAMRQVVADHARGKLRDKRGGGAKQVTLDASLGKGLEGGFDVLELDDCLSKLAEVNARHAQVVELRLFSGLSIDETAEVLGLSPRSVDSDWAMAKAWLRRELGRSE